MFDTSPPSAGFSSITNVISSSARFVSSAISFCFAFPFHFSLSLYPFALFFPFQLPFFLLQPLQYVPRGHNYSIYFECAYSTCWSSVPSSRKYRTKHVGSFVH